MMTAPMVKSPKLYLNDTGLCSFLILLDSVSELDASPLAGALWETLVCGELRRSQLNRRGGWNLHFWRDRVREADFLLHRAGKFDLADAKWSQHPEITGRVSAVSAGTLPSPLAATSFGDSVYSPSPVRVGRTSPRVMPKSCSWVC